MTTENVSRRYETRMKTRGDKSSALKSRVDWRRTKRDISQLLESEDDEGSESEGESEENSGENDGDNSSTDDEEEQESSKPVVQKEEAEDECIAPARRKRMSSVLYDPNSSSEDEEPVRKVFAKRRCRMDDESTSGESDENNIECKGDSLKETENAKTRKHNRQAKLKELSQKLLVALKSKNSAYFETSEEELLPEGTSDQESEDNGSLGDFIVEDENENEQGSESEHVTEPHSTASNHSVLLEHNIPIASDHFVHFQRIVKAFLINAMDDTFLVSLFDGTRQKRYAKEMVASLHHLDERILAPRLDNLKTRSRWREQYKVRVESYPFIKVIHHTYREMPCDACGLMRSISFQVILSGESYNNKTLMKDDFMAYDRQILKVGSICAERTRVYHQLKHFKYNLHKRCISIAQLAGAQLAGGNPLSIKDKVAMVFSRLEGAWIKTKYDVLQTYLNEADFFQEEMMD